LADVILLAERNKFCSAYSSSRLTAQLQAAAPELLLLLLLLTLTKATS